MQRKESNMVLIILKAHALGSDQILIILFMKEGILID